MEFQCWSCCTWIKIIISFMHYTGGIKLVCWWWLLIIRCYVKIASVSLAINFILWFVCCSAMFSAMIMSSIIGSTTLAFALAFSLGLFVTSAVMLHFGADANDKLKDLSWIVNNKLCNKILKHWQILIVMATHATELVLERPGFFWPTRSYHRFDNSSSHVAD